MRISKTAVIKKIDFNFLQNQGDNKIKSLLIDIEESNLDEYPNIKALNKKDKLELIENMWEMKDRIIKKNPKSKLSNIHLLSFYEKLLKNGEYRNKEETKKLEKAVYQYQLDYMKYNVDDKKFPRIKSLPTIKAVELTNKIAKEHPRMKINKILETLEKELSSKY